MPSPLIIAILANGDFPVHAYTALRACDGVVCCDCAYPELDILQIVGDLDTLSSEHRLQYADRITEYSNDQDTNDLSKAFHWAHAHYPDATFHLFGCTGKREDHTLANLSLLADFAALAPVKLFTETGTFSVASSDPIPTQRGQQISIFSFNPNQTITSTGLKYPLTALKLPRWWCASLNEALAETFSLSASTPDPILVYQETTNFNTS